MKALILLGGLGTRLRPFTLNKPKPLLPILNRPFFSYQLDQLRKHGVRDVILALGYQAGHFRRFLGDGRKHGMRFAYSLEEQPLGTGGAIRKAEALLGGPAFILNGDVLSDVDLAKMYKEHRRNKADATLALVSVKDPSSFGLIETAPSGRIRRFVEKPSPDEMNVDTINAGYYLFEPSVVRRIPADRPVSIERDVFPKLLGEGLPLYGHLHRGYWSDIGTMKSYWETHMDLLGEASFAKGGRSKKVREGLWVQGSCRLHNAVKVQGTAVLGEGCRVASNVVFSGRVCVGPRCVIGENAHLSDCVVHEGTRIGAYVRVENALVGERCRIEAHGHVGPGQVLAGGSVLGPHSRPVAGLVQDSHD